MPSHYTQNHIGAKSCVYKLGDYHAVLKCLKSSADIVVEDIPWGTFNVVERLSHSFAAGQWMPCRPEHLPDEKVDELMEKIPRRLLEALLPFQVDGLRFGLRRGGRCLIADEMGLGKTLQVFRLLKCDFRLKLCDISSYVCNKLFFFGCLRFLELGFCFFRWFYPVYTKYTVILWKTDEIHRDPDYMLLFSEYGTIVGSFICIQLLTKPLIMLVIFSGYCYCRMFHE